MALLRKQSCLQAQRRLLYFGDGPNTVSVSTVWFRAPNSVSFLALTKFQGDNSVSSSQPLVSVPKQAHRASCRTQGVWYRTQGVLSFEAVVSKQYSTRFILFHRFASSSWESPSMDQHQSRGKLFRSPYRYPLEARQESMDEVILQGIGPHEFACKFTWTNGSQISLKVRHRSIECSSLHLRSTSHQTSCKGSTSSRSSVIVKSDEIGGQNQKHKRLFGIVLGSIGENQKGTAGRGREKKCHDNLRQTSRQFTTCHDNLRHFMTISVSLFH